MALNAKRTSLPILPLRGDGLLLQPYSWSEQHEHEPPRALKSLARIVENDLCHRCGSCIGICPTQVLGLDDADYPVVNNLSACTDCDLCVKVCPGDEYNVPSIAHEMFSSVPDIRDMHGHFEHAYLTYASDPVVREGSTSGGLISGLLIWLLETNQIDGAVVIASDSDQLWKGKPIMARSREDVLRATKSKYAISPTNIIFQEIQDVPGRYAVVGLPCQIHGFHKAARLSKTISDRVVVTIGLFCHAAVEHDPMQFVWNSLGNVKNNATRFISRVGKHPGTPHVQYADGTTKPVYFPHKNGYRPSSLEILNIFYRLYTPMRCLTCYDSTAEFADIAVGDPWMAPPDSSIDFQDGYSFALARTARAKELLDKATTAGAIRCVEITAEHARSSNRMMGEEKRNRAFRVIETRRRQGKPIPDYGMPTPSIEPNKAIATELNMLSHFFCFVPWGKKTILRISFSEFGYQCLRLNYWRRQFRNWRRDLRHRLRSRFRGSVVVSDQRNDQRNTASRNA